MIVRLIALCLMVLGGTFGIAPSARAEFVIVVIRSTDAAPGSAAVQIIDSVLQDVIAGDTMAEHRVEFVQSEDLRGQRDALIQALGGDIVIDVILTVDDSGSFLQVHADSTRHDGEPSARAALLRQLIPLPGQQLADHRSHALRMLRTHVLPAVLAHFDPRGRDGLLAYCIWPDERSPDDTAAASQELTRNYVSGVLRSRLSDNFFVWGVPSEDVQSLCTRPPREEPAMYFRHRVEGTLVKRDGKLALHLVWIEKGRSEARPPMSVESEGANFDADLLSDDIIRWLEERMSE